MPEDGHIGIAEGARKSTAIKVLAGEEWFTDELPELGPKRGDNFAYCSKIKSTNWSPLIRRRRNKR